MIMHIKKEIQISLFFIIVSIKIGELGTGSGLVVTNDGYIVINSNREVVGINFLKLTKLSIEGIVVEGIGFAISINDIMQYLYIKNNECLI
jgi:S1-C subfamily serine protease